jgi:hypothetical protein
MSVRRLDSAKSAGRAWCITRDEVVQACSGCENGVMKLPLFVRSLTEAQRQCLQAGRRSRAVFTFCRSQILLLNAAGRPHLGNCRNRRRLCPDCAQCDPRVQCARRRLCAETVPSHTDQPSDFHAGPTGTVAGVAAPVSLRAHNQQARQTGDVRVVGCRLPTRGPWLNPIEPRWRHGKRALVQEHPVS